MEDNIWSMRPCSSTEYADLPTPVSQNSSLTSLSLACLPFMKYSFSPDRYNLRFISISGTSRGSTSPSLASVIDTSATERGRLFSVPLKMMSSMDSARRLFADCSPTTHFMASTMFDLPHPFGPSNAEIPGENSMRTLSAKDLNPNISRLFRNTKSFLSCKIKSTRRDAIACCRCSSISRTALLVLSYQKIICFLR